MNIYKNYNTAPRCSVVWYYVIIWVVKQYNYEIIWFFVEKTGAVLPQDKSSLTLTSNYRVPKSRHDYTRNTSLLPNIIKFNTFLKKKFRKRTILPCFDVWWSYCLGQYRWRRSRHSHTPQTLCINNTPSCTIIIMCGTIASHGSRYIMYYRWGTRPTTQDAKWLRGCSVLEWNH